MGGKRTQARSSSDVRTVGGGGKSVSPSHDPLSLSLSLSLSRLMTPLEVMMRTNDALLSAEAQYPPPLVFAEARERRRPVSKGREGQKETAMTI